MITNDGVELISKYLVGQASSYAAYIAVGSGARATSNNEPIVLSYGTATLDDYDGTEPYQASITLGGSVFLGYVDVGDTVSAAASSGSLNSGTVTVIEVLSPYSIRVESTEPLDVGSLQNVTVYSTPKSDSFTNKKNLDFEVARFPITSRSYVVEKQTAKATTLNITDRYEITVNTSDAHVFGVGDNVEISNVDVP
jgi:hypothetical protein